MKVVPEPSERCTTLICCAGRFTTRIELLDRRIVPVRDLAHKDFGQGRAVQGDIGPGSMPATLTTGTTPPITVGNWARPAFFSSLGVSGLSVAPKVTVLALIWAMPPPEPID